MKQKGLDFGETRAEPPKVPGRRSVTVSELTERIGSVLGTEFFDVWVEGEVSNLKLADSGHVYFSLKDDRAQIRAVVWRKAARLLRFKPADGVQVLARGTIQVYAPRGDYQLSVEAIEPLGKGSLQQAFEELKEKLQREGLFDAARKRPLPMLPQRVGIVTSPTGAVIRDILRVLRRRYRNLDVLLYPARVQGEDAAWEVAQGIRVLSAIPGLDVVIVARGGGSLEDLQAFNDETVARALEACPIPTLSAVGHETDYTIADFVADVRAPTPSAAAEMVVKAKEELSLRLRHLDGRREGALRLRFARTRAALAALAAHRVFEAERGRLRTAAQRTDELVRRAQAGLTRRGERAREHLLRLDERASAFRFDRQLAARRETLLRHREGLAGAIRQAIEAPRGRLARAAGKLDTLSPLAVLSRGYAVVFDAEGRRIVRRSSEVGPGDALRIRLQAGALRATVTEREIAE
ncbi:MAG TPA: exodeoxyribonuclease VII large subunit [Vicinamibacteria bacterium]|nr:exodeoxyribonuclease VII large subunit [Vicinamibacteria bacterium]